MNPHDKDDETRPRARPWTGKTDVTWSGGKGRQPYANQGKEEAPPASGANEFEAGDRGELSGNNLEQLDEVRKKP